MNTFKIILKPFGIGFLFLLMVTIFAPSFPFLGMLFDAIPVLFYIILYIITELYFKEIQIKVIIIGSLSFTVINLLVSLFVLNYSLDWILIYSLPILYMIVTISIIKISDR